MPSAGPNPEPIERLITELSRLPGIGRRSAERMSFHLLKAPREDAERLARAVMDVKDKVRHCAICFNLTDLDPCRICASEARDGSIVMVVEQPRDVISLDQTGLFRGVFHVLMGQIDALGGVEPADLTIAALLERVDDPARNCRRVPVREVILGLNPTLEGDSTALYLADELTSRGIAVTRLARGLPSGSQLEYASAAVLADAIEGRHRLGERTKEGDG